MVQHRHHANGEIAGNTATNLEETYAFAIAVFHVPIGQPSHILDTALHGGCLQFAFDHITGENVTHGAVFPTGYYDGQVALRRCQHPAVFWVDFVVLLQLTAVQNLVHVLVREISLALGFSAFPDAFDVLLQTTESLFFRNTGIGNAVVVVF